MKTVIVCMVYNAVEYLSEFIIHHSRLVDHIYLIDHKSRRDLRHLDVPGVAVFRSNQVAQFQSEVTNLVIDKLGIREDYDWLFVLDIDEFLPFAGRDEFHAFLDLHRRRKVLRFPWRNGVPFPGEGDARPRSLIDFDTISFFKHDSVNVKAFVNIRTTQGNFVVPTGAHHIRRRDNLWLFDQGFLKGRRKNYKSHLSERPLFHVIAFDKESFVRKIKNYVTQMGFREHIRGQGGWVVRDYPAELSGDEWLWYVANFRVADEKLHRPAAASDFVAEPIFRHLDVAKVRSLRDRIMALPEGEQSPQTEQEIAYLRRKIDDTDVSANVAWFDITGDNEIVCRSTG